MRVGLRVGDLRYMDFFEERFRSLAAYFQLVYPQLEIDYVRELDYYRNVRDAILDMTCDTIAYVNAEYAKGKQARSSCF
jgi:hypothetical protein